MYRKNKGLDCKNRANGRGGWVGLVGGFYGKTLKA
jgi:hypothetical protein